jgi:hypothetical protein
VASDLIIHYLHYPLDTSTQSKTMADHDECSAAVWNLLLHLPDNLNGLWLILPVAHNILKHHGGFS